MSELVLFSALILVVFVNHVVFSTLWRNPSILHKNPSILHRNHSAVASIFFYLMNSVLLIHNNTLVKKNKIINNPRSEMKWVYAVNHIFFIDQTPIDGWGITMATFIFPGTFLVPSSVLVDLSPQADFSKPIFAKVTFYHMTSRPVVLATTVASYSVRGVYNSNESFSDFLEQVEIAQTVHLT